MKIKDKKKFITTTAIIILSILIIIGFIITTIRDQKHKTEATQGQAIEEETILEAQISNNETDENTPVDENIIDEKSIK